jgi:hypothetical protein
MDGQCAKIVELATELGANLVETCAVSAVEVDGVSIAAFPKEADCDPCYAYYYVKGVLVHVGRVG